MKMSNYKLQITKVSDFKFKSSLVVFEIGNLTLPTEGRS
jgi:hypothetical protein